MPVSGTAATRYRWEITKLQDKFLQVDDKLSDTFDLTFHPNTKFQMFFNSCVPLVGDASPFGVIIKEAETSFPIKASIKFWIESSKGHKFVDHLFPDFEFENLEDKCAFSLEKGEEFKFFNKCFTANGTVTVCCELRYSILVKQGLDKKIKEQLDATVIVNGKRFKVIKSKLMSASPVFSNLFLAQIGSNTPNVISILNITPDMFQKIFQWTHFGWVDNLGHTCEEVFMAANEYDMPNLKMECLNAMCDYLEKDNVLARLILAFMYDVSRLKKSTLEFIMQKPYCENLKPLFISSEWCEVAQKNGELAGKILEAVFKRFDQLTV